MSQVDERPVRAREPWVSTEAVADHIGKPPSWVFNNAGKLGIPRTKIGKHYRYRLSEVDDWLDSLRARN